MPKKLTEEARRRRSLISSRLSKKGITGSDRRAILANMNIETAGSFDPSTKQRGVGKPKDWWKKTKAGRGTGLIQWDGSRRIELKKFAEGRGKKWDDLDTQVDFLDKELRTSEKRGFNKVKKAIGTKEKTKAFSKYVERPGKPHIKRREQAGLDEERREVEAQGRMLFGNPESLSESLRRQINNPTEETNNITGKSLVQIGDTGPNMANLDFNGSLLDRVRANSKPINEEEQEKIQREERTAITAAQGQLQQKQAGEQIIQSNPDQVKEVVRNLPDVDEETAEEVSRDIDAKISGGNRAGGVSSKFTEALTFFLPNIIGAIGGAALGGTAGMLAGEAKAGELAGSFRDHKLEQAKLAAKSTGGRPRIDVTPDFVDKETNQPIFTKEINGVPKFIDDQGNIIPSSRARSIKDIQFERREEGVQERFEGRLNESQVKRLESNLDKFSKANIGTRDAIQVTEPVINLVQSGVPITSDFLAPFIARGVQNEVGNLSETDLEKAKVPLDLAKRLQSDFIGFIQGDMTKTERQAVVRLLSFMNDEKKRVIKSNAKGFANKDRAKRVGISQKDLEKNLLDDTGLFNEVSSKPVQSGVSTQKQLEIIQRIKAKRK